MKLVITTIVNVPDSAVDQARAVPGRLQAVVPLFPSAGCSVQWPISMFDVGGQTVRCYHGQTYLGFELADGTHVVAPLINIARQVAAAVAPTQIGTFDAPDSNGSPPPERPNAN